MTIKIEPNDNAFTLTTDQLMTIANTVDEGWDLNYDIVQHDGSKPLVWLWVHHKEGNPDRLWIEPDGSINLAEEVTWLEEEDDEA